MPNGSILAKTYLWMRTDVKDGEVVELAGKPPNLAKGKVWVHERPTKTVVKGLQSFFSVDAEGVIYGRKFMPSASFDADTGLLLGAIGFEGEGTLIAMNILQVSTSGIVQQFLTDTNIDLGAPVYDLGVWELLEFLPSILAATVFSTSAFTLFWRRKAKRRRMKESVKR